MEMDDLKCYKITIRSMDVKAKEMLVETKHAHLPSMRDAEKHRDDLIDSRMTRDKFEHVSRAYSSVIERVFDWNTKDTYSIKPRKKAPVKGNCQSIW